MDTPERGTSPRVVLMYVIATLAIAIALLIALQGCHPAEAPRAGTQALHAREAWLRATPPGARVAAAYLALLNPGDQPRRIVGLRSDLADRVELHEMKIVDGQMRMRALQDPVVPARGELQLAPGSTHLMFIGLRRQPAAGETVALTIEFDDASTLELSLPVREAAPEGDGHGMHS